MESVAFLDGRYLRTNFGEQMQRFYGVVPEWDLTPLAKWLQVDRAFYYDAIDYDPRATEQPEQAVARVAKEEATLDYIGTWPDFHVRPGWVRGAKSKKRQKAVDVQLAVDAMELAARGQMRLAVLLAGDLDFEPLVSSLVRMGVRTRLAYVPQHTAEELKRAADQIRRVTLEQFHDWSAPSFRLNHPRVKVTEHVSEQPDEHIFDEIRSGAWRNRRVGLFRPKNQALPRIYVHAGNELREQARIVEHANEEKLPLAFELIFGTVNWNE